jgi:DNA-binding transcriptional MocR family regulator
MSAPVAGQPASEETHRITAEPLEGTATFKDRAYGALKEVLLSLDIYTRPGEIRLDERALALQFGISRTPVREAMAQLEREGFVPSIPRRGIYIVRKTRRGNPADRGLGCARKHGRAADHRTCFDRKFPSRDVRKVRERQVAREAR